LAPSTQRAKFTAIGSFGGFWRQVDDEDSAWGKPDSIVKTISIIGGSGQIGRALCEQFANRPDWRVTALARDPDQLAATLSPNVTTKFVDDLSGNQDDILVNCIGAGDPTRIRELGKSIIPLTEQYDRAILDVITNRRAALYVFLSSGIVHSRQIEGGEDWYTASKKQAEERHRKHPDLHIVDLRLFGFVSPYIDLAGRFFLSELFAATREGREFLVGSDEMYRDFVHPEDLSNLIELCGRNLPLNCGIDVYSREPVSRDAVLRRFAKEFGLRYRAVNNEELGNPASAKTPHYYSIDQWAAEIGYVPKYSAEEAVMEAWRLLAAKIDR
jgi:nucleoside-diphosphate-sugar epimerase